MAGRPSGTVTFLFSDVEGSTRLLGQLGPDRYRIALESHREIVRKAVARHEGHEVDTQGDSFLIAFRRATDRPAHSNGSVVSLRLDLRVELG